LYKLGRVKFKNSSRAFMAMYQEIQGLYRAEKKALEITERSKVKLFI
jgi:hypothetical protein